MSAMHLEVPFKVSVVGYYVNTACGAYLDGPSGRKAKTTDAGKVTCRGCKRTAAFAAAFVPEPVPAGPAGIPGEERDG